MKLTRFLASWIASAILFLAYTASAQDASATNSQPMSAKIAKWQAAAEKGESWAAFNLGLAHQVGKETARNLSEAVRWYRMAAEQGYAPAQANIGYCYDTGFGVGLDHAEAVKWYQMAAAQGHPFAQYNLGKRYQTGPGVGIDQNLAEKWLKQAAQQNFVAAYFSLGQIYANEGSGKYDIQEAHKWFRLAADQGYAPAQHAIGYLYFAGLGVSTNYFEAVKWYNLAVSRNFPDSHYNLGICYERGFGVPQNLIAAVNHHRTAAESGHAYAQYSLGVCYYEGRGVEVDFLQSYKWWNLAAVQGIPEAASSRDILSRLMNESQIKQAQDLASKFEPRLSPSSESSKLVQTASGDASEIKKMGTGFFISADGYLITTLRTLAGGTNIQVITEGGRFKAVITKADPLNDLVLLKVAGAFQPLPIISSKDIPPNMEIVAVGVDEQVQFIPKLARGKITSPLGYQADPRQFSLEPRVTPSFGGAAIVSRAGQVIGMIVSGLEESALPRTQPDSSSFSSYAIKSDHLMSFLRTVPDVKLIPEATKSTDEITPEEILSKARAATALVLVL